MPRYIDADVLRSVFTEKSAENVIGIDLCKAIISRIDQIPTADVVPVVRCGNAFPSPCANCINNPVNGGSGICHCTIGGQTIY